MVLRVDQLKVQITIRSSSIAAFDMGGEPEACPASRRVFRRNNH